jgi:hypothetical protein
MGVVTLRSHPAPACPSGPDEPVQPESRRNANEDYLAPAGPFGRCRDEGDVTPRSQSRGHTSARDLQLTRSLPQQRKNNRLGHVRTGFGRLDFGRRAHEKNAGPNRRTRLAARAIEGSELPPNVARISSRRLPARRAQRSRATLGVPGATKVSGEASHLRTQLGIERSRVARYAGGMGAPIAACAAWRADARAGAASRSSACRQTCPKSRAELSRRRRKSSHWARDKTSPCWNEACSANCRRRSSGEGIRGICPSALWLRFQRPSRSTENRPGHEVRPLWSSTVTARAGSRNAQA